MPEHHLARPVARVRTLAATAGLILLSACSVPAQTSGPPATTAQQQLEGPIPAQKGNVAGADPALVSRSENRGMGL